MENKLPVRCSDNEAIVQYLCVKKQEVVERGGISEKLDLTLSKAYRNICGSKKPIKTLKDLSQIKGIGKWILRLMHGFFPSDVAGASSPSKNYSQNGMKAKEPKRYVPQKNSVAYALLITLYRGIANGVTYMMKQELIDAAEASGLSRVAIWPDKVKGRPGQFGNSSRDWYTGWSCMKTLISKGLVAKSSCPAKFKTKYDKYWWMIRLRTSFLIRKYMLTQEGQEVAKECLSRSSLSDVTKVKAFGSKSDSFVKQSFDAVFVASIDVAPIASSFVNIPKGMNDTSVNLVGQDFQIGSPVSVDCDFECVGNDFPKNSICSSLKIDNYNDRLCSVDSSHTSSLSIGVASSYSYPKACTSFLPQTNVVDRDINALAMPPYNQGEKFEEVYDIILILDDREKFGSQSRKVIEIIHSQFNLLVEVRRLPIGDGIWIARHTKSYVEYVLDFIVERKKVDDLCSSIQDNRYRDQKLRLQRCGLRKLIFLVEGDPSLLEAAESIKTACLTTEILEGFNVQRTNGFADTVRRYGFLSLSIKQYYCEMFSTINASNCCVCPTFSAFVKRCQDLEKITVSDVFSLQLMQAPLVTEEIASEVIDLYPTLLSLARAYSLLEGNVRAQEQMLKDQCKLISSGASKNIFKLVWGS